MNCFFIFFTFLGFCSFSILCRATRDTVGSTYESITDEQLSEKIKSNYLKIRSAINNSSADEFASLLAISHDDFFNTASELLPQLSKEEIKKWWSRSLENGMAFLSFREESQLPLIYFLLYDDGIQDRGEKIRLFADYGGFFDSHIDSLDSIGFKDSNLYYALNYLKNGFNNNFDIFPILVDIFYSADTHRHNEDENILKLYVLDYLEKNYIQIIINQALNSDSIENALSIADIVFENRFEVVKPYQEQGTQIYIPVGSPVLDQIIFHMNNLKSIINTKKYRSDLGSWESKDILSEFFESNLDHENFSEESVQVLSDLYLQKNNLLSEQQWQALKMFLKLGLLRDKIFSYLGKTYITKIIDKQNSREFQEFIKYLRRKRNKFRMLSMFGGLEKLFFLGQNEDLAIRSCKNRAYDILTNMIFLLGDRVFQYDTDGNSSLHHVLLNRGDTLGCYESDESEKHAEKIVRLFLFSGRINKQYLLASIVSKNHQGDTCLSIAAKKGLYRCFEVMRDFLLASDSFELSQHSISEELNLTLLKGLKSRHEAIPINAIAAQKEVVDNMIDNYFTLEFYDSNNKVHQSLMNITLSRLEKVLTKDYKTHHGEQDSIYRKAFKVIRRTFEKGFKSRAFMRAPLAVQLSYYDMPFRFLINKVIEDLPEGGLDHEEISDFLIEDLLDMSDSLRNHFKKLVEEECNANSKKSQISDPNSGHNAAKWLAWAYCNPKYSQTNQVCLN